MYAKRGLTGPVWQQPGSGEGSGHDKGAVRVPAQAPSCRLGPGRRGASRRARPVPKGRNLSQLSHGLAGRHGTMASMPDIDQDADLRIRIPAHCPDALH
jgi:hypothetical protein